MTLLNLLNGYQIPQVISTGLLQNQLNTIFADIYARLVGPSASGNAATTDATATTALTFATASNKSYLLTLKIIGRRTGGVSGSAGDSGGFYLDVLAKNVAGTLSIVGTQSLTPIFRDQILWTVAASVSGTNLLVKVTGAVGNNVSWSISGTVLAL